MQCNKEDHRAEPQQARHCREPLACKVALHLRVVCFAKLGLPHISLSAFLTPYGVTHLSLLVLIIELRQTSSTSNSTNHEISLLTSLCPFPLHPCVFMIALQWSPDFVRSAERKEILHCARSERYIPLCKIRKRYWIASHCFALCSCPAADQLPPRLLLLSCCCIYLDQQLHHSHPLGHQSKFSSVGKVSWCGNPSLSSSSPPCLKQCSMIRSGRASANLTLFLPFKATNEAEHAVGPVRYDIPMEGCKKLIGWIGHQEIASTGFP